METSRPYVLCLMGRAELRDPDGAVVPLPTRKTLLLLAVLVAAAGERLSRAEVAATVWDGGDPKTGREGLRTALAALRKVVPVEADRESVGLRPGLVVEDRDGAGEFMPGFDNDWAIERRLRLRAALAKEAIDLARRGRSLEQAERACRIDPFDPEAAALRAELLRGAGRGRDAVVVEDSHRARLLRELGMVSEPRPAPPAPEHPLIAAAEWTLDRDPAEACALLAGTQNQWLTLSVERSLSFHERVLAANPRPSRERGIVQAGAYCLLTLNGRLGNLEPVVESYRAALDSGERGVGARLIDALAYASLSKGDFSGALEFAREGLRLARLRDLPTATTDADVTLGIIEQHALGAAPTLRRVECAYLNAQEHGTAYMAASYGSGYADSLLIHGQIEKAARVLDATHRLADALGSDRFRAWVLHVEAHLYEATGDLCAARTALERFRAAAPAAGQSAVALADDALFRVNCELREFDEAVGALARGAAYRRRMGTVASRFERAQIRPSLRTLRERLGSRELEAIFRRAALT